MKIETRIVESKTGEVSMFHPEYKDYTGKWCLIRPSVICSAITEDEKEMALIRAKQDIDNFLKPQEQKENQTYIKYP